jgi:hypothetical protein
MAQTTTLHLPSVIQQTAGHETHRQETPARKETLLPGNFNQKAGSLIPDHFLSLTLTGIPPLQCGIANST